MQLCEAGGEGDVFVITRLTEDALKCRVIPVLSTTRCEPIVIPDEGNRLTTGAEAGSLQKFC